MKLATTPRILYLPLEFRSWKDAQYWSYPMGLGVEEGFGELGLSWLTLPVLFDTPTSAPQQWISHLRKLCAGQSFDQIWFTANHTDYDDATIECLIDLAPVRVGFFVESLVISANEYRCSPDLCRVRERRTETALKLATHATVFDEGDVDVLTRRGIPSMWWPGTTPSRFVCTQLPAPPTEAPALFFGAVYGDRGAWLEEPSLEGLLVRPSHSLEHDTPNPDRFDALQKEAGAFLTFSAMRNYPALGIRLMKRFFSRVLQRTTQDVLNTRAGDLVSALDVYLAAMRRIRQECFGLWLQTLQRGVAIVNLPQYGSGYSGRVFEAMAAGVPAIVHRIPGRPRTEALFDVHRELLVYSTPSELTDHIRRLQTDHRLRNEISVRARDTILARHTTGHRVAQCLHWIQTGHPPTHRD